jgi:catechol 2,3-dioxygenase-like lactoylglutathione lyase family enzyme
VPGGPEARYVWRAEFDMPSVKLSIQARLCGPVSLGTVDVIKIVRAHADLTLGEAKALVDRCVFDSETVAITGLSDLAANSLVADLLALPDAPPMDMRVEPETTSKVALALVVLGCRNLDSSRRFYESLGLVFATERHGSGPLHYSSALGTTVLELYPASSATSNVRLGLVVPDVASAVESVRSEGGQVDREPTTSRTTALVRDPDGNPVELSPT